MPGGEDQKAFGRSRRSRGADLPCDGSSGESRARVEHNDGIATIEPKNAPFARRSGDLSNFHAHADAFRARARRSKNESTWNKLMLENVREYYSIFFTALLKP